MHCHRSRRIKPISSRTANCFVLPRAQVVQQTKQLLIAASDPGVTQRAARLETEDDFDPPFDFFDGAFRQSAKFFGEGFIGHGDQLPEQ
jgi:hypothetical protein